MGHTTYTYGRTFTWLLGLKETKFVLGYSSLEVDVAIANGELDARSNNTAELLRRNPDAVKKGLFDFVAILKIPREDKEPEFDHLPEVDNFAKSERERRFLQFNAFYQTGRHALHHSSEYAQRAGADTARGNKENLSRPRIPQGIQEADGRRSERADAGKSRRNHPGRYRVTRRRLSFSIQSMATSLCRRVRFDVNPAALGKKKNMGFP